ncbi:hypothetical protein JCM11641_000093 [Rhodosporidiobolus odoratus]
MSTTNVYINPQSATAPNAVDGHSFDSLLSLETTFYQRGHDNGLPHGELHGMIEGRELGREKAWEIWEEIGYAEGTAMLWKAMLAKNGVEGGRANHNLDTLFSLIASFPTSNDSSSLSQTAPTSSITSTETSSTPPASVQQDDVDIPALLTSLRSKYRTACASLGVRPRMAVAGAGGGDGGVGDGVERRMGEGMSV